MEDAEELVRVERDLKVVNADAAKLKKRKETLKARLLDAMENGLYPASSGVLGATVFTRSQVWAGPRDGDHEALTEALEALGLDEFKPKTVNTNTLSGYVRELLSSLEGDASLLSIEERIALTVPPELRAVLNVTEKTEVRVNGA